MPIAIDMKNITQGIEVSYGERVAFLSDLSKDTHDTLKTFHREHQTMAGDLGDSLSSDRDNREKAVASLLSSFHANHQAMAAEIKRQAVKVKQMLAFFDSEHQAKSDQVRKEIYAFNKQLKSAVSEIRHSNRSDHGQARKHWQNLARIMAAKRAGKAVTEDTAEAKATIADVFSAVKIKEQMMRMISATASGLSLAQMAQALGIPYIRLAKPATELVKQGEIEKRDSKYFTA